MTEDNKPRKTPGKRKYRRKKAKEEPKDTYCLGFVFTPEEEERIERAKRNARKFMEKYGKGERPYAIRIDITKYSSPYRIKK